jgi:hypothetical protein
MAGLVHVMRAIWRIDAHGWMESANVEGRDTPNHSPRTATATKRARPPSLLRNGSFQPNGFGS